jgi:hypothetical protein
MLDPEKRDDLNQSLYDALVANLLEKIKNKTATAADLAVARAFLKDNNISSVPTKKNGLGKLTEKLAPLSLDGLVEDYRN